MGSLDLFTIPNKNRPTHEDNQDFCYFRFQLFLSCSSLRSSAFSSRQFTCLCLDLVSYSIVNVRLFWVRLVLDRQHQLVLVHLSLCKFAILFIGDAWYGLLVSFLWLLLMCMSYGTNMSQVAPIVSPLFSSAPQVYFCTFSHVCGRPQRLLLSSFRIPYALPIPLTLLYPSFSFFDFS